MAIITAGMIGIGKSTVAKMIGEHFGTKVFYESVEDNPILKDFYEDQKRWAFALQIYFMNTRVTSYQNSLENRNNVLDRSIFEDILFAKVNTLQGNMSKIELDTYLTTLQNVTKQLEKKETERPDLLVYLDGSFETIMNRIKKRGRSFELDENLVEYYKLLHSQYPNWLKEYTHSPTLIIDMDKFDVTKDNDAKEVLSLIEKKIKGLEKDLINN